MHTCTHTRPNTYPRIYARTPTTHAPHTCIHTYAHTFPTHAPHTCINTYAHTFPTHAPHTCIHTYISHIRTTHIHTTHGSIWIQHHIQSNKQMSIRNQFRTVTYILIVPVLLQTQLTFLCWTGRYADHSLRNMYMICSVGKPFISDSTGNQMVDFNGSRVKLHNKKDNGWLGGGIQAPNNPESDQPVVVNI